MADETMLLSSYDKDGALQYRHAVSRAQEALNEGRAVLFIRGGELVEPSNFFSSRGGNLQRQIEIALKGGNVDESQLAEAYSAAPTAYAETQYRADQVASIPLMVTNPGGVKQEWNPAAYFISTAPIVLWHVESSLIIFGKSYLRKLYNESGYPTGLQWVHNDLLRYDARMWKNKGGWLLKDGDEQLELYKEEVVSLENFDPSGAKRARSEYEVALAGITTERGAGHFTAAFFVNEARPDGMLISKRRLDPSSEEYKKAREEWRQFQGAGNAHKTFFASGEWEWIPITPPLIDLALNDVRNSAVLSISETLRVNPVLVGAASVADQLSAQNTFRQIERHHLEAVTIPRLERLILPALNEQWLWVDFSRPHYFTLAIDRKRIELLSDTNTETITAGMNATLSGFADYDEGREIAGLEPREQGDYYKRDPQKAIETYNAAFTTLDESRHFSGLEPLPMNGGKIIKLPTGQIIPAARLLEVANAQADALIAAAENPQSNQLIPQFLSKIDSLVETVRAQLIAGAANHPAQIILNPQPAQATQLPAGTPAILSSRNPSRAVDKIEISLDLSNNAFIRYAARTLSRNLSGADILSTAWVDSERWRLPLIALRDVSPSTAATLLRELELEGLSRLDLMLEQVVYNDGAIQAAFTPSPALNKIQRDISLQVEAAGIENVLLPAPVVTLGYVTQEVDSSLLTLDTVYPLSAVSMVMTVDNQVAHVWTLRSASPAQLKELDNWKHRATRHKRTAENPIVNFEPYALRDSRVADFVQWGLVLGADTDELFKRARGWLRGESVPLIAHDLSTPDDYEAYWKRYDSLAAAVGESWLDDYMSKAWATLQPMIRAGDVPQEGDIGAALNAHHNDLIEKWIGTNEEPGALIKLVYAGMAAGNESVLNNLPADYRGAYHDMSVQIQWDVISQGARDFVQGYSFDLIRNLDSTTRERVRAALDTYLKEQKTLDELEQDLSAHFTDPVRARRIAQTESIRAYNNGVDLRWKQVGVSAARWVTVRDSKVCPVCEQLNGQLAPLDDGWIHPGGQATNEATGEVADAERYKGRSYKHPAHTGCRCFKKPQVPDKATIDYSQFGGKPNAPDGGDKPDDPKDPAPDPARAARLRRQQLAVRKALDDAKDELNAVRVAMKKEQEKQHDLLARISAANDERRSLALGAERDRINKITREIMDLRQKRTAESGSRFGTYGLTDEQMTIYVDYTQKIEALEVQRAAAEKKHEAQLKKHDSKLNKLNKEYQESYANVTGATVRTPQKLDLYIPTAKGFSAKTEAGKKLKTAQTWVQEYFNGEVYGRATIYAKQHKGRANFNPRDKSINVSGADMLSTYIHELCHGIEDRNPDIARRCVEFREYRTQGETPEKMSKLTGNSGYADYEVAKPDKFYNAYVGKIYRDSSGKDYATEILSMGVEYFFNDPIGFEASDPEYFDFIVAILKGLI